MPPSSSTPSTTQVSLFQVHGSKTPLLMTEHKTIDHETLTCDTGVLEKYGALCIGVIGEAPKDGPAPSAAAVVDDDDRTFGDMIPFGDPSW